MIPFPSPWAAPDGVDAATRRLIHLGGIQKVVMVELFRDLTLTSKGDATNWSYRDLELDWLLRLAPCLDEIKPYTNTTGSTANHMWKVVLWSSYDGRIWSTNPTDLFSAITAGSGSQVQTPFTGTAQAGPLLRAGVGVKNSTGAAIETANVSCTVGLVFRT